MNTDTIITTLKSPVFWVCTVLIGFIFGIIQNLISHWLIAKFPHKAKGIITKISEKWDTRTKERWEQREKRIKALMENPQEQTFLISLATNKMINGFIQTGLTFLLGIGVLICLNGVFYDKQGGWHYVQGITAVVFLIIFTCLGFHVATESFHDAEEIRKDVEDARKRLNLRVA